MADKTNSIKEERFTVEQVAASLELTKGNVSLAARNLATSRTTLYEYMQRYPELKQALVDARESMLDNAESALALAATKGEGWAVCFMLKCLGRSRGYIEKLEIDHRITADIESELARLGLAETAGVSPAPPADTDSRLVN